MNHWQKTLIAVSLCGASLLPSSGNALTFRQETPPSGLLLLRLDGKIEHGDELKLPEFYQRAVAQYPDKKPIVFLNSRGGFVSAGIKLAEFIRSKKLPVAVEARAECNSACFMLFAAGTPRYIGRGATIGVHSVYDTDKEAEDEESQAVTLRMSRILMQYGAPPHIIGKLIATNFREIYKLSEPDLQAMQVTILDENPARVVTAPVVAPAKPVVTAAIPPVTQKPMAITKPLATTKPLAPVTSKTVTSKPPAPTATTAEGPHSLLGKFFYFIAGK